MALICAAESCKAHSFENDNCNLVFFPFPEDEETCQVWLLRSGRHDLLSKTVEEIHLTEFLCERHFEDNCLDKTGPVALKPKAKPTLFDHDISQFTSEIAEEKSIENSVSPDIVVIPCVIMDAGVNTEVIGFDGESVKEETMDRADIERELQLIHERDYVGSSVLSQNSERIDIHQQVINDLQPSVEDSTILDPDTLVVDSIHAVDSSEWQEESLTNLANQICRICASENVEMISMFEEQSIQLQIIDKIQWHLPIVIKEDDKLPLKVCTNCVSLLNSWHDLVATCVEADAKLRKLFKVDEQYDPSTDVYCDLGADNPTGTLEEDVAAMQSVLNGNALVSQSADQNVVPLDGISLQATGESIGLEITKGPQLNGQRIRTIEFFNGAKEVQEKTEMHSSLENSISVDPLPVNDVNTTNQFSVECTSVDDEHEPICRIKEVVYSEPCNTVQQVQPQSERGGDDCEVVYNDQQTTAQQSHTQSEGDDDSEEVYNEPSSTDQQSHSQAEGDDNDCEKDVVYDMEESVDEEDCASSDTESKHKVSENVEELIKSEEPEEMEIKPAIENRHFCDICGYSARKKRNLLLHISRKHSTDSAQFTCDYCDKLFENESAKKFHERTHIYPVKDPSAVAFVCEYCGRSFRSKKTLKEHHIAMHSDDKPYKCDKCDKNYGSLSSLDIHRATHSSETPFLCDLCGKTFKHVSNLRSHKRSHLDESDKNRQICQKCGKGFRSRFHLSEHMNVHEGNRPYTCDVCGKRFHKKIQLRQHGSAHSGTQPYKCPICGVKFNRRGNMTQHVKRHSQERKYTCRVCNESFPTLGAVLNHRKKHSELEVQRSMNQQASADDPDQIAFKCSVCGKLLAKKESLSIHMRSHTGVKLYPCPECGKRLSNKGSLTYHIRSFHTGERPHACQYCGDGFLSKEARLVHERIHTGEKPYECLVCGMAFRCSSNLAQHARVHSDARPHPCLTCGKRFQRKGALDVHMRTHTGERPYACDICGRAFTQKNDMLKHRRTHTNEKPFRCDTCGNIFSQKRDLTKHKLAKHNIEEIPATEIMEPELPQTVVITTSENLLTAFPEISVPGIEHTQTVILQRF